MEGGGREKKSVAKSGFANRDPLITARGEAAEEIAEYLLGDEEMMNCDDDFLCAHSQWLSDSGALFWPWHEGCE